MGYPKKHHSPMRVPPPLRGEQKKRSPRGIPQTEHIVQLPEWLPLYEAIVILKTFGVHPDEIDQFPQKTVFHTTHETAPIAFDWKYRFYAPSAGATPIFELETPDNQYTLSYQPDSGATFVVSRLLNQPICQESLIRLRRVGSLYLMLGAPPNFRCTGSLEQTRPYDYIELLSTYQPRENPLGELFYNGHRILLYDDPDGAQLWHRFWMYLSEAVPLGVHLHAREILQFVAQVQSCVCERLSFSFSVQRRF